MIRDETSAQQAQPRITSYNVCYTKLLRWSPLRRPFLRTWARETYTSFGPGR
ncbi:hypothetical protein [Streptomyces cyaneogriseus]|uniref:hypothetical protein n=1 Tax=Streptomyces cyaneogriseus TaxID=68192 RepID=UPI003D18ECDD